MGFFFSTHEYRTYSSSSGVLFLLLVVESVLHRASCNRQTVLSSLLHPSARPFASPRRTVICFLYFSSQPEPEFESEGTAELLGVDTATTTAKGGSSAPSSHFGRDRQSFDGTVGGGVGSGLAPVTLSVGSYCIPAEAFLGPPERATTTWAGFQTVWSGLPYVHAFPVETCCRLRGGLSSEETASFLRTAGGIRLAMSGSGSGARGGSGSRGAAVAAAVVCPGGNTDYTVSAAWAFEAWDGTPVLCTLTAMKAPFSLVPSVGVGRKDAGPGAAGGGQSCWYGRVEVRCGSPACVDFAQSTSARLTRFVTNGVFAPPPPSPHGDGQQRQHESYEGAFLPAANAGGSLNGAHADWFSRTDTSVPGSGGMRASAPPSRPTVGGVATDVWKVLPLVREVREKGCVDTTRAAQRGGGSGVA